MFWRRKSREEDLERELRSDLELETAEQEEKGLSPDQARWAARRAFGNITFTKEEVRQMWTWTRWEIVLQDVRYALRTLLKSPGFALTAILTLALGIGASTAVFTVVDSIVLKPLAYRDSGKLVIAWERVRSGEPIGPNPRHVNVWQKRATAFSGLTFLRHMAMGLTLGAEHPNLIGAVACLPNLFDILQVQPLLGRVFIPEDGVKGHDNVAILSYPLWQSLFHGDAGVIGRTIRLDDVPRHVVGILPRDFHFPNANGLRSTRSKQALSSAPDAVVFFPVALDLTQFAWNGNYGNWIALGRLKPGITIQEAEAQLTAIEAQIVTEMSGKQGDRRPGALRASLQPMQEAVVGDVRTGLWLLMAAVFGLMLIACLNLANAQLGRALARRREAAVRAALGAAKWRLVWNALTENLLLAVTGGAAGILLAFAALGLFRRYSPVDLPRLSEVHLNVKRDITPNSLPEQKKRCKLALIFPLHKRSPKLDARAKIPDQLSAKAKQSRGIKAAKTALAYNAIGSAQSVSSHYFPPLFVPGEQVLIHGVEAIQVERPSGTLSHGTEGGLAQPANFP